MPQIFGTKFLLAQGAGIKYEILRKCHYVLDIPGFETRLACQDMTPPRYELEPISVYYYNDQVKIASKPNPSELNIHVLDYVDPRTAELFWDWFKLIYDPATRNMGYASTYKRRGTLELFDPNGKSRRTWTMGGLWPKNMPIPGDGYSYEAGQEPVKIEIVFSCDWISMDGSSAA